MLLHKLYGIKLWLILTLLLILTIVSGYKHDYTAYVKQWQLIWEGWDPWLFPDFTPTGNAYGPAFLLLSPIAAIHPLAPKTLMALSFILTATWIISKKLNHSSYCNKKKLTDFWLFLFSPYIIIQCFYYVDIDVLVAVLCIIAIQACKEHKYNLSGLCLAFSALLKFFPIVMLPFLSINGKKINWALIISTLSTILLAFIFCYYLWGENVFYPLTFASAREPKLLSLFRALSGKFSPFTYFWPQLNPANLSLPLMAISGTALFLYHLKKPFSPTGGSLLALITVLGWYKVGHHQFYLVVLLMAFLYIHEGDRNAHQKPLVCFNIWLSLFSLMYIWTGSFNFAPWQPVKEVLGYIHFGFLVWLYFTFWKAEHRSQTYGSLIA